ncbi:MAG: hypothetical protein EU539_00910 [Promethearchaeota archaeon]|nr:MAG: hypothetical protein EU539_00910 [Candidatus Lokiarchaeota archaeon]
MFVEYFYLYFFVLLISYFLLLFGFVYLSNKLDILNVILGFGALLFVFTNILIILLLMRPVKTLQDELLPLFLSILLLPLVFIAISIITSTILVRFYRFWKKDDSSGRLEEKWAKRVEVRSKVRDDVYRKINHVFIFISLLIIWYLSYIMVREFIDEERQNGIKIDPQNTNMLYLYESLLMGSKSINELLFGLEWFYYVLFFFFYVMCLVMLINELTRKSKKLSFPFNFFPNLIMSHEEKKSYGTYLYFSIGHMFSAFICPPMVFFAILGMSSLGDLVTSQIGIRYGRRHIKWNPRKTHEGAVAGTIVSFIISIIFVGVIYALIFALAFLIFDIITNKPINLSDNLLTPIGCALIFVLIRFTFDLDYNSCILIFLFR